MKNSSLFYIQSNTDLSAADFKVLALLYQPLMGLEAHALYTTFYQLINKTQRKSYTHQELFDLLDLKQLDFLKMRHKLEALNLLAVYQKDDHYIYQMKTPLTAKSFLVDTIFGSYLQSEIGEKNLKLLTEIFKMDTLSCDGYDNITKNFDELYEFKSLNLLSIDHELQGRTTNGGSHVNYTFHYDVFVERLPERLKNSQLLNERFKEQINKIAFVYHFDIDDMIEIYEHSTRSNRSATFAQLNLKAKQHYDKKHQTLTVETKNDDPMILDQISPQVVIQKYAKTDYQGLALQTATQLLERNAVEPGIVNVILTLILKHKDGVLPNINYMEKVLHSWLNKGVQTTEDAIKFASNLETQYETRKKSERVAVTEPEWMDEYMAELAKMEG